MARSRHAGAVSIDDGNTSKRRCTGRKRPQSGMAPRATPAGRWFDVAAEVKMPSLLAVRTFATGAAVLIASAAAAQVTPLAITQGQR